MTITKNDEKLYKVVIWLCGEQDHDKEYFIYGFKSIPEAYEALCEELEGVKKWWVKADGEIYEMTTEERERLGYGRFR